MCKNGFIHVHDTITPQSHLQCEFRPHFENKTFLGTISLPNGGLQKTICNQNHLSNMTSYLSSRIPLSRDKSIPKHCSSITRSESPGNLTPINHQERSTFSTRNRTSKAHESQKKQKKSYRAIEKYVATI